MPLNIADARSRMNAACADGLLFCPLLLLDWHARYADWCLAATFTYFLLSFQASWVYSVLFHGWRGQTPGKWRFGIRVVRYPSGDRLGWGRAVMRESPYIAIVVVDTAVWVAWHAAYLAEWNTDEFDTWAQGLFDALFYVSLGWIGLEFLTMMLHPQRRAIHDLLAGSVVVVDEPHPVV